MKNTRKNVRQAILIITLIITYSSFSDCFYTVNNAANSSNTLTNTNNLPINSPYVFYYHLPSMPLEENYANLFLKVPYRLITYRLGTITGMLHAFLTDTVSILVILAALSLKLPASDKPRLYSRLPLRGHGPPKERLIFSLS
ncbi:hypothetical protein SAMN02745136_02674 [Anaerocolumna jejuensis DSM 15929]|uniref:Uncharacterized protein n=1 Tax=Anaerocolumna jejuensis DSM 15929 TaxID=1121322 RepID=A0A1M6T0A9_9FIRM|nr:hypothetical protein [Anaerocolumna jejuensis]SHK50401.1 hypothetical protein SAMN02745136_02674 [Anaerocolumna jejuensis DSM 15929]